MYFFLLEAEVVWLYIKSRLSCATFSSLWQVPGTNIQRDQGFISACEFRDAVHHGKNALASGQSLPWWWECEIQPGSPFHGGENVRWQFLPSYKWANRTRALEASTASQSSTDSWKPMVQMYRPTSTFQIHASMFYLCLCHDTKHNQYNFKSLQCFNCPKLLERPKSLLRFKANS